MRAPASAWAFDSVRRMASVGKRASQGVRLGAARPLDVGLVDHDDGLAVERSAEISRARAASSRLPVGLFGEHRYTSLTLGCQAASSRSGSRAQPRSRSSGHLDHLGALNARGNLVHAEGRACIAGWRRCRRAGRCATADRWLRRCRGSRARISAGNAVERGQLPISACGLRFGIAIEACRGGVARGRHGASLACKRVRARAARRHAHRP